MTRRATAFVLFLTAFGTGPLRAQPARTAADSATVRLESPTTKKRLAEVQSKIQTGHGDEALRELQEILDAAGDELISQSSPDRLIPARRVAHALIATLPPATLKTYQDRVRSAATALLDRAKKSHDPAPLNELLSRYFPSRVAPDALLLLGDLRLERGEFAGAEATYRRLIPSPDSVGWTVVSPPKDLAAVSARIALAVVMHGDAGRTAAALDDFAKEFPDANGAFAGRTGRYLDILKDVAKANPAGTVSYSPHGSWNALGGDAGRSGRVDSRLPAVWPAGPTWRTPIPPPNGRFGVKSSPEVVTKSAANHPVILHGQAYLADAGRVLRFDAKTGRAELVYDVRGEGTLSEFAEDDLRQPPKYDADFSLSVADGRLYARLGPPALWRPSTVDAPTKPTSVLIRFSAVNGRLKPDWRKTPPGPAGTVWQGAPAVADGRIVAATVRADGGRLVHSLVCFDAASPNPLWAADVADSPVPAGEPQTRHDLVSLADDLAVYNTNAGGIVAVRAATGKPAWAVKYASVKPSGKALVLASAANHRDLAAPVSHDGTVFAAPTDCETVFAIEAASGRVLWEKSGLRVETLVGVTKHKLIATLAGPVRGVRAFDVRTGSDEFPLGWRNHDDPGLASLGRGLVSDEQILWPTRGGLFPLRPLDGRLARPPIPGPHGNLAFAEGVLIVANPTEVLGYVIPEELRKPRPVANPPSPPARIAIQQSPSVAVADPTPVSPKELPPVAPQTIAETIAVPWAAGVLPSDAKAGIWVVNGRTVAPVSPEGDVGKRIDIPFAPTAVFGIGKKSRAFTDDRSLFRPDGEATFCVNELHDDAEPMRGTAVGFGIVAALVGRHHLLALDAVTLQLRWVVDASGRPGYWPYRHANAPQFGPHAFVTSSGVIAQTLDGKATLYDLATGAARFSRNTTATPWPSPPAVLGESLVLAGGPGSLILLDPLEGDVKWESRPANESGLTGLAPAVRVFDGLLFGAVSRNHGVEIQQLDPETGRAKWPRPFFVPVSTPDLSAYDCDGATLFVPHGNRLVAVRLIDGRPIWAVTLPYEWGRVCATAAVGGVVVTPLEAVPRETANDAFVYHSFTRFPDPRRVLGCLATLAEPLWDRHFPVAVYDAVSGANRRTIDLPAAGPGAVCRWTPNGGVVATAGKVYLLK